MPSRKQQQEPTLEKDESESAAAEAGGQNKKNKSQTLSAGGSKIEIRGIKENEVGAAAELIARLKRLNGEFDPLLKTSDKVEVDAVRSLKELLSDNKKNALVQVAVSNSKIVGVVKAVLRDRVFYEPRKEGAIVEFYILPEFRRGNLGRELFDAMVSALKEKGAQLITAEFPSQNEIAKKFYVKLGFRSLTNVYAR